MENETLENKRKYGIYYTPNELAEYLVQPLIGNKSVALLDPAYGEGSLLLAAESIFEKRVNNGDKLKLYGCDIHPVNGLLKHLPEANLKEKDFFSFSVENKYDVILTNPPYVRRQNQNKELIKKYKEKYKSLNALGDNADLWAYFLIKSVLHLKKSGSVGAIVPWAFLQADYAKDLRKLLLNKFKSIKVLALNNAYFDGATERVVLIWMENYGNKTNDISIAFSNNIKDDFVYQKLSSQDWISSKIVPKTLNELNPIFSELKKEFGFQSFKKYAEIKIGIVTGANKFFVRDWSVLQEIGIPRNQTIPVLTKSNELTGYLVNEIDNLKRLFYIDESQSQKFDSLISSGEELNFHLRVHSKMRKPWYSIKASPIPDAFFPYRVGKLPFMVLNKNKIQSLNSIHRIYFKSLTLNEIKWVHLSLLSIYGQLSLLYNAKTYGRGMIKMEPGALGQVLVLKKDEKLITKAYKRINSLLKKNEKLKAIIMATDFIDENLFIPNELRQKAIKSFNVIQKASVPAKNIF